jgi:hypothetical protein
MKTHSPQRGSTTVEFALAVPILIIIVVGILEMSWFFHHQLSANQAAEDGARVASVTPIGGGFEARVRARVEQSLHGARLDIDNVDIRVVHGQDGIGLEEVVVTVEAAYNPLIGLLPTPTRLRGTAVAHLEDPP